VSVLSVQAADGTIYTFGRSPIVDTFAPSTHTWSHRAPFPRSAGNATAVAGQDGKIYVSVGRTLEAYDPTTKSWTERRALPVYRNDAAAVNGKDGKIYIVGGAKPDPGDNSNTLYPRGLDVYDPKTNVWQVKAPMPTAREGLGAAVAPDGTIYAIGGGTDHYDRFFRCLSVVEAYNPRNNTWSKLAPLPQPMCGVTAGTTSSGRLVAVGGSTLQGGEQGSRITTATGTILALNPGATRWKVLSRTPFPRKHAGSVIAPDGTVYVIGGADAFGTASAAVQKCTRCGAG
jgi:N-acetylneuraminic acid mutarotase